MAIQVNIFEAGSVPTAQELAALINELNTTLDDSVTLTGEQSITGVKTFLGSKLLKFKQNVSADKLGFTLYDYQSKEVGNFEYDNKNNFRLLALGNYVSTAAQEVECNIGFKIYNKLQSAAYRLLCPLAGNAKNSIPTLSETYTNFYMPLVFTNGSASVTTNNNGEVDLSALIGSGSGDTSGLATVATTGDYNDLLNRPALFSGNYNDLTNKPTLFSGSYNDLTDKPTLFSGDYDDLANKPTIPVVDLTRSQADNLYQPKGNYALASELFSGSYNDLTDKPSLFSGSYNDLSDKPTIPTVPTISTNIASDATSDTKTASPKAVKDFVESKGYLTQHQDISGKADQSDLESLEDRVEALEQSGSGGGNTNVVDSAISSTSEHALQNKVLYNELRITENGSVNLLIFTPTNTEYEAVPIRNVSANDFQTIVIDGGITAYLLPDGSEAYNISNTDGKTFGITGDNDATLFKFDSTNVSIVSDVDSTIRLQEFASVTTSDYIRFELSAGEELNFDETLYLPIDTVIVNGTINSSTQTTTVVKSLKQKIAELESNTSIDSELSSVSEKALQNKVLYDELRITESGSQTLRVSNNGTLTNELPIVEYDANSLQIQDEHYLIPGTPQNCAISVTNCAGKSFYFNGDPVDYGADFALKMDAECSIGGTAYGMPEDLVNRWLVMPDWYVENFGGENYGFDGDLDDNDEGVTTEVTGSSVTVKSLKQKIAELEARIAQISAQLQS